MSICSMPSNDSTPTTTSYAILGLLSVQSWTTYELAKQVKRSLSWFWPRAERKLYDEPKRLVADGLATAVREYTGQRPRTVYSITADGQAALSEWLGRPPAPRSAEFEAMLKVFFADAGTLDQLTDTLRQIEAEATTRLSELREVNQANLDGSSRFPERLHLSVLALRLHTEQELTVARWARWAQQQIQAWHDTSEPGDWDIRAAEQEMDDRAQANTPEVKRPRRGSEPGARE